MKFQNPSNGYVESASVPFLWCLVFGIFYFMSKGIWRHVLIPLTLALVIAAMTGGLGLVIVPFIWLLYAFFARGIVKSHYGRKGWSEIA